MNVAALLFALLVLPTLAEADMLNAGDRFPDWSLTDHSGNPISSKDLAGRTYLLWYYPKASTPG
jgi:peroxiredoxin Q/BCP